MRRRRVYCFALILLLFLFPSLSCKKNPVVPNAEELTRPVIWLNTFEMSFAGHESGGNPEGQVFQVKNSGKNTLSYSISDDAEWLSVEPAGGSSMGQLVEHTILINKAGLAARDDGYEATISVVSPEAYNNPQRVHVSLKISAQPPPKIWARPEEMMFSAKVGENPADQTLRVKNTGEGTLHYDITTDVPWLTVAPAGGSSAGGEKSHTVSVNSRNLAEGSYSGTITISSDEASNNPQSISVSLQVSAKPPPVIWVSLLEMAFSAKVGESPAAQTLRVKNAGEGTLSYDISWDAGWLDVAPASGASAGDERSHTVTVDSRNLGAGSYNGTIVVSSANASNSPQSISVSLKVSDSTPPPPPVTDNSISISCNPSSGGTGTAVSIPISIRGNLKSISTFGLTLNFDANLFEYVGTTKGGLTGSWAMVDGNLSGTGKATVGGFAGSGNAIPVGSVGTIAVVTLKVTGAGYSDGQQSQLSISSYADDISGMTPQPATTTFTFRK
ncbi:MAG: choice-of-anchor D domain-containing protein [Candidatus Aminicenantales bacterium]